jgi:CRISPR-associated protein (TIGR03984 family)
MNPVTLYSAAADGVTLPWTLRHAAPPGGIALLISPRRYHVALLNDTREITPRNGEIHLDDVFEARIFSPIAELRWLHTGDGKGRAALLTEDAMALPDEMSERPAPINAADTNAGGYLLWGRVAGTAHDGWTTFATERIGTLDIPAAVPAGHAHVATREYIAVDPSHGNAYIAEERLLHFEPISPARPKDS